MAKLGLLKRACITLVVCMAAAIAAPAQTLTTLHSFYGTDGSNPNGLVQAIDGNLYGTTSAGGSYSNGTVFKITPQGTLTTLYNFCAQTNCSDGVNPDARLVQATDGNLYGTTGWGGLYNGGTVFKITAEGTLSTLYSFCAQTNCTDGEWPDGLMQATDGNFYGITHEGGSSSNCQFGCGTIFKIAPGGTLTTIYSFCTGSCSDGYSPMGELIQATDGNLYGTTQAIGGVNGGTVFKITLEGTLTTLYTFCAQAGCTDGWGPNSPLFQATDGNFYGTTCCGASGSGTVFKITPMGTLTTLHSFDPFYFPDGQDPSAAVVQAADGNFYGTTYFGGTNQNCKVGHHLRKCGTVFEITAAGTLITLHDFCVQSGCPDGANPRAGLIQASDGNFYGTTSCWFLNIDCGNGQGTVFRLAAAPAVKLSTILLRLGNQALDETSTAKTVTLKNSGTALLNISGITITGSSFAISANTCGAVLGVGKICKVSVTFTPTVLGKLTGSLTFNDNAGNSPQTVALSGKGVQPATVMPATASYVAQAVGTTSPPKAFTLTNNQSVTLNSIAISTTGDFAVSATTCGTSLAAKAKCTISVSFTPTQTGTRSGQLSVSDSANNSPQTSSLKGTGE